ncbi:aminotransferase class III-fold pyridoxal phosphate-dependent enzyme [Nonomuraea endophytica]|uniref:aminotransferase class III-fold pyridoxal phosphate-dependent enzyme n=1 Tax=Nonomuraea endophytica TaxID=714136 RepID=UPI0037CC0128
MDLDSSIMRAAGMRERDRRHVWHTWTPLREDRAQAMFSHGEGYRVWDVDGKEYIDATSCALSAVCGYRHPELDAAVERQLRRLHHFDLSAGSHEPAGLLAERIASYLPDGLSRTLFVNSGSEGFEAAMMIAAAHHAHLGRPRSRMVSFARGYHGSTLLCRSLSALPRVGHLFEAPLPVTHVELPAAPARLRRPDALQPLMRAFERAFGDDPGDLPMAVAVEPFLNVGGGIMLPPGFLPALRRLCDRTGTLLVLDEIFTGYGRTGRMFAHQHEPGAEPDILVTSKGLSGGYVPIGAVTVKEHLHQGFRHDPVLGGLRYGHTNSGHALACAAALATLDLLDKHDLPHQAEVLGARLLERLAPLAATGRVADVRGLGLITVVELATPEAATRLVAQARRRGLLLRRQGPEGLAVMAAPPLTIDQQGIDTLADRLWLALADQ